MPKTAAFKHPAVPDHFLHYRKHLLSSFEQNFFENGQRL